jgi:hypothetical protein
VKAVLLVTWIIAGQPPNSYQTQFDTLEAGQAARIAVKVLVSRGNGSKMLPGHESHDGFFG